jgi:hypothetical protein
VIHPGFKWLPLAIAFGALASGQSALKDLKEKTTETPSAALLSASAWETLDKGLQHDDSDLRKKAIGAVGTIGAAPDAVRRVVQTLHDKNTLVPPEGRGHFGRHGFARRDSGT